MLACVHELQALQQLVQLEGRRDAFDEGLSDFFVFQAPHAGRLTMLAVIFLH